MVSIIDCILFVLDLCSCTEILKNTSKGEKNQSYLFITLIWVDSIELKVVRGFFIQRKEKGGRDSFSGEEKLVNVKNY